MSEIYDLIGEPPEGADEQHIGLSVSLEELAIINTTLLDNLLRLEKEGDFVTSEPDLYRKIINLQHKIDELGAAYYEEKPIYELIGRG